MTSKVLQSFVDFWFCVIFSSGYENGIDDLYDRLLNVFLEMLEKHRSPLTPDPTQNTNNTSVVTTTTTTNTNNVPKTDSSGGDDQHLGQTIIPVVTSSVTDDVDDDVLRLKEEMRALDLNTDDNRNTTNDKRNSKERDQLLLCNHRNCPLTAPNSTQLPGDDPLIWNEMRSTEKEVSDSPMCPCHHNTWTVN